MSEPLAYYNEHDKLKAEVLREAIKAGAIAPGDVDERSICDVRGSDLRGYRQCHFFAGGGFWSLALRWAGWPDSRPVWTGSCPCPSFSCAGKGGGFDDPRHLWPDWARLIRECRPATVFGEQADDAVGYGWVDLVQTDLEAEAYAFGKVVFGAHSVGAGHIRQRLYFVGDTDDEGAVHLHTRMRLRESRYPASPLQRGMPGPQSLPQAPSRLSDTSFVREFDAGQRSNSQASEWGRLSASSGRGRGTAGSSGHTALAGGAEFGIDPERAGLQRHAGNEREWRGPGWLDPEQARSAAEAGATRGFWGGCDWWYGRDGKHRPIGPGLFPLAHGSAARVGRLRLYGDAIVVPQAAEFIRAYREATEGVSA